MIEIPNKLEGCEPSKNFSIPWLLKNLNSIHLSGNPVTLYVALWMRLNIRTMSSCCCSSSMSLTSMRGKHLHLSLFLMVRALLIWWLSRVPLTLVIRSTRRSSLRYRKRTSCPICQTLTMLPSSGLVRKWSTVLPPP